MSCLCSLLINILGDNVASSSFQRMNWGTLYSDDRLEYLTKFKFNSKQVTVNRVGTLKVWMESRQLMTIPVIWSLPCIYLHLHCHVGGQHRCAPSSYSIVKTSYWNSQYVQYHLHKFLCILDTLRSTHINTSTSSLPPIVKYNHPFRNGCWCHWRWREPTVRDLGQEIKVRSSQRKSVESALKVSFSTTLSWGKTGLHVSFIMENAGHNTSQR